MPTRKLKVMHLILNLDVGGAQEVVRTLVEHLASAECQPVVCTFKDGPLRQDIERAGIKVEVLPGRRYSIMAFPLFVADMIRIWRSLARQVDRYDLDIVQTHLLRTLDFLVLLLRFTTPLRAVLWTFHSANVSLAKAELPGHKWLHQAKRLAHNLLYRWATHLVSGCIAVSDEVKMAALQTIGPIQAKTTVICNGVDLRRYGPAADKTQLRRRLGLEPQGRLLIMVGTLKEAKGHCYMLEAMASIVPRCPDVHLLLVGDGELRASLQAQAHRLQLDGQLHFLGNRHDVPELLAASDIFVMSSLWEGLSMALLEAMAAGLPIVTTAVSGAVQVIIPGQTGLLVPPGNAQKLTEAVLQLLADPACAQALGAAARERAAAEFSAQKQAQEHLALYRRLVGDAAA